MGAKQKAVIYGVGHFFKQYQEQVEEEYQIVGYIDVRGGVYNGRKIAASIEEYNGDYEKVLIMVQDWDAMMEIVNQLLRYGIHQEQIALGVFLWGIYSCYTAASVTKEGKIRLEKDDIAISVSTKDEFMNVTDTLIMECYKYNIGQKREVVFDVGMNIGDSSLYFLHKKNVDKVYAFEPFAKPYQDALANLKEYEGTERLEIFQWGLSDHDEIITVESNKDMTCGQSTIQAVNRFAIENYANWGLVDQKDNVHENVCIKKSSPVIKDMLARHTDVVFVLKLDCEGEEYAIVRDLASGGVLKQFSYIMMEWHYRGAQEIESILEKEGFFYAGAAQSLSPDRGVLYAWNNV